MDHKFSEMVVPILFLIMFTAVIPLSYAVEWSPEMRLTWDTGHDWGPSIAQTSDGKIWVVWYTDRTGNLEIFYKTYNASEVHPWSPDIQLTNDTSVDITPSIMRASDDKIWVVWARNNDLYYKVYNGSSWSPDTPLITGSGKDEFPSITQTLDDTIWIVWSSNRTGNFEIFYTTYNGSSWSPDTPLTNDTSKDRSPSIMQAVDDKIWVVWHTERMGNLEIFYNIYNGSSWLLEDMRLTWDSGCDWHPSIMQLSDETIWVAWDTDRLGLGRTDLYYKTSFDNGDNWTPDMPLVKQAESSDIMPSIMQAMDGTIWLVWTSTRCDNVDIYYKTDSVPDAHDVAIFSVVPPTMAIQGETVSIKVVAQNHGTTLDENLTVHCYANTTLIGYTTEPIHIAAGQLWVETFTWNTSGFIPGVYVIRAEASVVLGETHTDDNTYIDGMVKVKGPGDVNGDGYVDYVDLFPPLLATAYGSSVANTTGRWNPDCDFNFDGWVDYEDLGILAANYGKHYGY